MLVRSAADVLGGGGAFTVLVRSADVLFGKGGGLLGGAELIAPGGGGLVGGGLIGSVALVVLGGGALIALSRGGFIVVGGREGRNGDGAGGEGGGGLIAVSISVELMITTSPNTCNDEAGSESRHSKANASHVPAKSSHRKKRMTRQPQSWRGLRRLQRSCPQRCCP